MGRCLRLSLVVLLCFCSCVYDLLIDDLISVFRLTQALNLSLGLLQWVFAGLLCIINSMTNLLFLLHTVHIYKHEGIYLGWFSISYICTAVLHFQQYLTLHLFNII